MEQANETMDSCFSEHEAQDHDHRHSAACSHAHQVDLSDTSGSRTRVKSFQFWIRLALGVVFLVASADKIYQPAAFAQAVHNYQVLPDSFINLTAIILPWQELLLGIFLIMAWWLPGTVTLTNALLLTFFGALIFNLARGLDVHCGCFSSSAKGDPATAWYLVRDAVFLLMGGYLFFSAVISRRLSVAPRDAS